ncbi:unnamed protein product, partial [Heterosigma akashiwo]
VAGAPGRGFQRRTRPCGPTCSWTSSSRSGEIQSLWNVMGMLYLQVCRSQVRRKRTPRRGLFQRAAAAAAAGRPGASLRARARR